MRKLLTIFMLCSIFSCSATIDFVLEVEASGILRVPQDYPTIDEAVRSGDIGCTIHVSSGIYYEHITVPWGLSLIGESPETTIIDGDGFGIVISVSLILQKSARIEGFTIRNGEAGVFIDSEGVTVENNNIVNTDTGVALLESHDNYIKGNSIENNGHGIKLGSSDGNIISGNTLTGNEFGIYLSECSNNLVAENNLVSNELNGILLSNSDNNILRKNVVTDAYVGIGLTSCESNTLEQNILSDNLFGIGLVDSNENILRNNNITHNDFYATFMEHCNQNRIVKNTMANNGFSGLTLTYSNLNVIESNDLSNNLLADVHLNSSSSNHFYHNMLQTVDNRLSTNAWDNGYPSGGNYWTNYGGSDLLCDVNQTASGSDGIGDSTYFIDSYNQDSYPLMGVFSDYQIAETHVQTICNSTISNFQFNGTSISLEVMSENGTTCFCRICVPKAVINDSFTICLDGADSTYSLLPCSNSTHSYLYVNYTSSTKEIIVTPEYSSIFALSVLMIALLPAAIYKRKKGARA